MNSGLSQKNSGKSEKKNIPEQALIVYAINLWQMQWQKSLLSDLLNNCILSSYAPSPQIFMTKFLRQSDAMRKPILIFGKKNGSTERVWVYHHFISELCMWNRDILKKRYMLSQHNKTSTLITNTDKHKLAVHI